MPKYKSYKSRKGRKPLGASRVWKATTGGGVVRTAAALANNIVAAKNAYVKGKNTINMLKNMGRAFNYARGRANLRKNDVTRKELGWEDPSNQWTHASYAMGRPKTFRQIMPRLVRANVDKLTYQFSGQKFFDDSGYYQSYQYLNPAGVNSLPIYCFDLTARDVGTSGALPIPFKRMVINTVNGAADEGKVKWVSETSIAPIGTTTVASWSMVQSPGSTGNLKASTDMEFLNWTSIKLALYGAINKCTEWNVKIIQILDQDLDPWVYDGTTSTMHQVYWQSDIKSKCWHPQANFVNPHKNKVRVLKSIRHVIQPNSTTSGDGDANVRLVNIFNRWNRLIDYRQKGTPVGIGSGAPFSTTDQTLTSISQTVPQGWVGDYLTDSKSKIMLLITSSAFTPSHEVFSSSTDASFDMCIRKNITARVNL